jgi:hypothetical protein
VRGPRAAILALAGLASMAAAAPPLDHAAEALTRELNPRAREALARIPDPGRRLLALRGYLRAGPQLPDRWSWSDAEAATWAASPGKLDLDVAIADVRCAFESANPGYTLYVNPTFRSLDLQVDRWNGNPSVGLAAEDLLARVQDASRGKTVDASALKRWLLEYRPTPVPTLAVPGLSPHGRMQAVDFQVLSGEQLVAGTDSAAVAAGWIEAGWAERLQQAVARSGTAFTGPLESPAEPWHYEFRPGTQPTGAPRGADCLAAG